MYLLQYILAYSLRTHTLVLRKNYETEWSERHVRAHACTHCLNGVRSIQRHVEFHRLMQHQLLFR